MGGVDVPPGAERGGEWGYPLLHCGKGLGRGLCENFFVFFVENTIF